VYAATLALNAGAVDRAVALLNAALQQQGDNDAAEYMLGVALAVKGDQPGRSSTWARARAESGLPRLAAQGTELEALRQTAELQALVAPPRRRPAGKSVPSRASAADGPRSGASPPPTAD